MKLNKLTKNLQPALVMTAGAIGSGYLTKVIPFGSDRVKDGICAVLGLAMSGSKGMVGNLGTGVFIGSAARLAKGFGIGGGDMINGIDDARFINGIDDLTAGGQVLGVPGDNFAYNENDSYA
jgi:hypothetical protein